MNELFEDTSFVCVRCAGVNPTCCRLTPGQEDLCFPVSEMERQRIVEHAPAVGGLTGARNSKEFLAHLMRLFPRDKARVAALFPAHAQHLRLATHRDGRCAFLGPSGCSLPREARPYYCRLFPFWVSAGAVTAFEAKTCLASQEGRTVSAVLGLMGMTPVMVRRLHGQLRLAWGLDPGDDPDEPGKAREKVVNNA